MDALEDRIKREAHRLGFDLVGIAAGTEADTFAHFCDWLDAGYAGAMDYLHRHADARQHPASVLPGVRSVVMVGLNYKAENGSPRGGIASYARGADYHDVLWKKLDSLLAWVQGQVPACRGRGVVDTTPLLERDFARRAGLGWFGKNTMLLNKHLGSFFFLGALLLDLELRPDAPHESSHCGTCTACLDACPTQAFVGPGVLDARRCISYLTIELRGPIPEELREGVGHWLFGCDVCQDVCPWNRKAPAGVEPDLQESKAAQAQTVCLEPAELLALSEEEFRRRFRKTALWRARRRGLLRNAAVVLGNRGDASHLPVLRRALGDAEPLVRDAARWAIDRIVERNRGQEAGPS